VKGETISQTIAGVAGGITKGEAMEAEWSPEFRTAEAIEHDEKLAALSQLYWRGQVSLTTRQIKGWDVDLYREGDPEWMHRPTELDLVALRSQITELTGFVPCSDDDEQPDCAMMDQYIAALVAGKREEFLTRLAGGDERE
jgi:hypothetical protein